MKFASILVAAAFLCFQANAQHAGHLKPSTANHKTIPATKEQIKLEYKGPLTLKAGTQSVSFMLRNNKSKPLRESDLETLHEKKLHVIVYDASLNEFFHAHPQEKDGLWTTDPIDFKHNGTYFFWVEGKPTGASTEFNKSIKLNVVGGKPAFEVGKNLKAVTSASSGNSVVKLKLADALVAKQEVMPVLEFSRSDRSSLQMTPYLGALAHVIVVPLAGDKLIHVHPMAGTQPNELMIHTTFPAKGDYRIWVQFIDGGQLKVVPLAVQVK